MCSSPWALRKRYLMWIFPPVSIAHRHHRRTGRRCKSVIARRRSSGLSRLLWFSWHPWEEPCSDRAITTTHTHSRGCCCCCCWLHCTRDAATRAYTLTHTHARIHTPPDLRLCLAALPLRRDRVFYSRKPKPGVCASQWLCAPAVALRVAAARSVHSAQPSDDYAAHARCRFLASPGKSSV